jgi:hypothetical protein
MELHVEHRRQELLAQAQQERLAKEAINGRPTIRRGRAGVEAAVADGFRSIVASWRPGLGKSLDLPLSNPGEAT